MNQITNEQIFSELGSGDLSLLLKKYCDNNEINKLKYIFESDVLKSLYEPNETFEAILEAKQQIILDAKLIKKCCELNSLEIVKYILSYCNNIVNPLDLEDLKHELNEGLAIACAKGSIDVLDYILNSKDIQNHAQIRNDDPIYYACSNDQLEILEYLINHPKSSIHAKHSAKSGRLLETACKHGDLATIKYVLQQPKIKDDIDIHSKYDIAFRELLDKEKMDAIQYFVFELKIKKNSNIDDLLDIFKNDLVKKMFEKRELKIELESNFNDNENSKIKKIKI